MALKEKITATTIAFFLSLGTAPQTLSPATHEYSFVPHKQTEKKQNLKPKISITFDDGYDSSNVQKIVDIFKKYNCKGSFFIPGIVLENNPEFWQKIVLKDHFEVYNHTQTHADLSNCTESQIIREINEFEATYIKIFGQDRFFDMKLSAPYIRIPYLSGENNKKIIDIIEKQFGYKIIGCDIETVELLGLSNSKIEGIGKVTDKLSDHIINNTQKRDIILLHFNDWDVSKFDKTLNGLIRKFNPVPLYDLLIPRGQQVPIV